MKLFLSSSPTSVAVCWTSSRGQPCLTSTPPSYSRSCSPSCSTASTAQVYSLHRYHGTTLPSRLCTTWLQQGLTLSLRASCIFFWWLACSASSRSASCSATFAPRSWRALTIRTTSTSPKTGPRWWLHPRPWLRLCKGQLQITEPPARSQSSSATLQQLEQLPD